MELEGAATIEQLLARYADGVDDRRYEDVGRLFTLDARLVVGRHTIEGRAAIVATLESAGANSAPGKHVCMNIDAEVQDQRATVACDFVTIQADRTVGNAGRYTDELVCTDGRWQFATRQIRVTVK